MGDIDLIALAIEAAEQVFDLERPSFEPTDAETAWTAVQHLGELFGDLRPAIAAALGAAWGSGTLLSSDQLQGLVEIIQNADDVEATEVRFLLRPTELLACHNGTPVRLEHVMSLATPWLSTKADDAEAIGRFGVGLTTLQSLSTTLEVHCPPYHCRIGETTVAPTEVPDLPSRFCEPGWTTLRIPLQPGRLQSRELEDWFDRWDSSALLFLRHVACVRLLDRDGSPIRELRLSRRAGEDLAVGSDPAAVSREFADTADGRSWVVYSADFSTPEGVERARKAMGPTTPIAVAFPLGNSDAGQIYAGLPVAPIRSPLFANAQFDPLTSRTDLAGSAWNIALVSLVAEMWAEAVLDLFRRDSKTAWRAIPLPHSGEKDGVSSPVIETLEAAVLDKARGVVASRLSFPVPEQGDVNLSQLAVEAEPLEGVLQEDEIARLAALGATLPIGVRDPAGRWRAVLEDWRSQRDDLPAPVSVKRALNLLYDGRRPAGPTIALVAVALRQGLGTSLLGLPCVIAHDGQRLVPPPPNSAAVVSAGTAPLAEQLGISTLLHSDHLADANGAPEVLAWLRECGVLLDRADDAEVIRRLAKAGRSGSSIGSLLTVEQVRALRDAFEPLSRSDLAGLGPDVGRAVRLESYRYDANGHKEPGTARPVDAYLPRAIDTGLGSFAAAADKSQNLVWLSDHYAKTLRSPAGPEGIGPQQFLRLLGAETAPRSRPHPQLLPRYQSDGRQGLYRDIEGGPEARKSAMKERSATYTLEDHDSPDLLAVTMDIALEQRGERRRARARALLAALGRAWDSRLKKLAEVHAANDYYSWELKGRISAFWLAQAGDVAWLDDESGNARKPTDLRVRTPGTEAIYGANSPDYLHPDLDLQIRRTVLTALGVSSDPSRSELVGRLRRLRQAPLENDISSEELRHEAALVYRALTQSLAGEPDDFDLTTSQLRQHFALHRLVFTSLGWRSPQNVLAGQPIFGDLRAFAPVPTECDPLWRTLGLRKPSPSDCLEVLRQVASRRTDAPDNQEKGILLETLRILAEHYERRNTVERKKLATLALWTSKGWMRKRPVYATDDSVLAEGLGDRLPIWRPGGELEQFRSLLEPLRVTEIQASEAAVIEPEKALEDGNLTELFQTALALLRDDLQRNDRELANGLTEPWDSLTAFHVKVHPHLSLAISVAPDQEHTCEVNAKIDTARATLFVTGREVLARVDGGGRALAALFEGNARHVAQAWLAACDRAEEGLRPQTLELASDRTERETAALATDPRLTGLRDRIAQTSGSARGSADREASRDQQSEAHRNESEQRQQPPAVIARRILVDPQSLMLVDPEGRIDTGSPGRASISGEGAVSRSGLNEPAYSSLGPRNKSPLRQYSDLDKESVGLELLKMLLSSDHDDIVDLRTQRYVGADAVDQLKNFYELKVTAGSEPNEVALTDSEVQRARSTLDFFLVVVSNLEGDDARPTVRIVVDPLEQLQQTIRGTLTLSGFSEATTLLYEFAPIDDQQPTH